MGKRSNIRKVPTASRPVPETLCMAWDPWTEESDNGTETIAEFGSF